MQKYLAARYEGRTVVCHEGTHYQVWDSGTRWGHTAEDNSWGCDGEHASWRDLSLDEIDNVRVERAISAVTTVPYGRVLIAKNKFGSTVVIEAGDECRPYWLRHGKLLVPGDSKVVEMHQVLWYVHNRFGHSEQWEVLCPATVPRSRRGSFAKATWSWLLRSGVPEPTARKLMDTKICGPQCAYAAVYWEQKAHGAYTDWTLVTLVVGFLELLRQAHLKVEFVNSACEELRLPKPKQGWRSDDSTQRIFAGVLELMRIPKRSR